MEAKSWLLNMRQAGLRKEFGGAVHSNEYKTNRKTDKLQMRYQPANEGRDSFTIFARGLNIDSSYISEYWQWTTDRNGEDIEVAKAVKLKWLGVNGSFKTINLTHGVPYKVSFLLRTTSLGGMEGQMSLGGMEEQMVNLTLTLPAGTNQEHQAKLPKSSETWHELEVGQFTMTSKFTGEMKFAMTGEFESWKGGLIIKGVEIKPK